VCVWVFLSVVIWTWGSMLVCLVFVLLFVVVCGFGVDCLSFVCCCSLFVLCFMLVVWLLVVCCPRILRLVYRCFLVCFVSYLTPYPAYLPNFTVV